MALIAPTAFDSANDKNVFSETGNHVQSTRLVVDRMTNTVDDVGLKPLKPQTNNGANNFPQAVEIDCSTQAASAHTINDVEKFLGLLAEGDPVTFQTFDDSESKRKNLIKVMHGDLAKHRDLLQSLNDRGAGIFVTVNATDQRGRKRENIVRVRAAFVDLDGAPIEPILSAPLPPHLIIESSPSRYHAYWLTDGIALDEFRPIQETLAQRFNADPVVKDLPRVMRLPGFFHRKGSPFLTRILKINTRGRYNRPDLIEAFGIDVSPISWKNDESIAKGKRNDTLFRMARGLVEKGTARPGITERLLTVNEQRCRPPLADAEIFGIVGQAIQYGANGAVTTAYQEFDSPMYRALSPRARDLRQITRRLAKDSDQAQIALLPREMNEWGFGNAKTLAKYRDELIIGGWLVVHRAPRYGQSGLTRECGLYRIATPTFMANIAISQPRFYGKKY